MAKETSTWADDEATTAAGAGGTEAVATMATTTRLRPTPLAPRLVRNQRLRPLTPSPAGVLASGAAQRLVRRRATPWATATTADQTTDKPGLRAGLAMAEEEGGKRLERRGRLEAGAVVVVERRRVPHRRPAGRGTSPRGLAAVAGGKKDVVRRGMGLR